MPGGPEYPVLGGVRHKIGGVPPVYSQSGATTPSVSTDFIASVTQVYAPSLSALGFGTPFIASVTALYGPSLSYGGSTANVSVAGTYTWVCPPGVTTAYVECIGGGGGGGSGTTKE